MSEYRDRRRVETHVVVQTQPSNGMGVAGFVVSLIGLVGTCGLLCPLGFLFSLIGLGKEPRGLAIAGTVIGGVGCLFLSVLAIYIFAILGDFGMDWGFESDEVRIERSEEAVEEAAELIEQKREELSRLPSAGDGNRLISTVTDGWQRSLMYVVEGGAYDVISAGPDAEFFNDDDIFHHSEPDPPDAGSPR